MAEGDVRADTLRMTFDPTVSFFYVIQAEAELLGLARQVGRAVVPHVPEPLEWTFTAASSNGVVNFDVSPRLGEKAQMKVSEHTTDETVAVVADGLAQLDAEPQRPQLFNDSALEHARELARLGPQLGRLFISSSRRDVALTERLVANVDRILEPAYNDPGSVEGTLEGLNLHGDPYFSVYDFLNRRRIRCDFGKRIDIERVKAALMKRVAVYGTIHYRPDGEPTRVTADELHVFPSDNDLPSTDDIRGLYR